MLEKLANRTDTYSAIITLYSRLVSADISRLLIPAGIACLLMVAWSLWAYRTKTSNSRATDAVNRSLPILLLVAGVAIGLYFALTKASLFDDAYISLRYSDNFAAGHGLVFNVGERVEGYTNFLWTLLIGSAIYLLPLEPPLIAIGLSLIAFLINFWVVYNIALTTASANNRCFSLPISVVMMGLCSTFTDYGTTGLETACASLWVNLGILFLIQPATHRRMLLAGFMFILATLTRPDHSIFFAAGGASLLTGLALKLRNSQNRFTLLKQHSIQILYYSLPFVLYGMYLIWKYSYYGDIFPNTYYAKMVSKSYVDQGLVYTLLFYLENHFWWIGLLFVGSLFLPAKSDEAHRFKVFAALSVIIYQGYIIKIGGDFMHGRFFVSQIPILLLGVEMLVQHIIGNNPKPIRLLAGTLLVSIIFAGSGHAHIFEKKSRRWMVSDESRFYRVTHYSPVVVRHFSYPLAIRMKALLTDRGLTPTISTHGIGMIAYYTKLETIDQLGLTDRYVAKLPVKVRTLPGHEKQAPMDYLRARNVLIGRLEWRTPKRFERVARIFWGKRLDKGWSFAKYDKNWIKRLKRVSPEIGFQDFEKYLDQYIRGMKKKPSEAILKDLIWFESYYFNHNNDKKRYGKFLNAMEQFQLPVCEMPIEQSISRQN